MPEPSNKAVLSRTSSVSPDAPAATGPRPLKVKNPQATATYVPEVARLTH